MARKRRDKLKEEDLQGFKYFQILRPLLESLHEVGTQRDRAENRQLHFDQYCALLLLYFFNPVLSSLRGIQQASQLDKVQKKLGCRSTSLGSLSEAAGVFDAQRLEEVIAELAACIPQQTLTRDQQALRNLTAVDGSLLPALPRMAWALWLDDKHRAAKMHVAFEVMRGIPVKVTLTEGSGNEKHQLRGMLEPGRLYVIDRGYADYQLFQDIFDGGSSFIGRIRANAVWAVVEERPVSAKAEAVGVRRDLVVRLGCDKSGKVLKQPLRIVEVETGKTNTRGEPEILLLATDRMDLDAELVAAGYRYRWSVELFFRWLKCILNCRHLISHSQNGVAIQVYLAIIASLLISLWTGRKPTKRTFEMLCFYFSGLASEEELLAHIAKLKIRDA
jgi:hypothetical protein